MGGSGRGPHKMPWMDFPMPGRGCQSIKMEEAAEGDENPALPGGGILTLWVRDGHYGLWVSLALKGRGLNRAAGGTESIAPEAIRPGLKRVLQKSSSLREECLSG